MDMKTIHSLPFAMVVAFLNALACTSSFPAGIDNSSAGGSSPSGGGGVDSGTGGVGGAAGTEVGGAPAVGGTAGGADVGGAPAVGGTAGGGISAVGGATRGTQGGGTGGAADAAGTDAGGAPDLATDLPLDGGACTWPASFTSSDDAGSVGCWAHVNTNVCQVPAGDVVDSHGTILAPDGTPVADVSCRQACVASEYVVQCVGEMSSRPLTIPTPDSSLACRVLALPTPSNEIFYCCPCGPPVATASGTDAGGAPDFASDLAPAPFQHRSAPASCPSQRGPGPSCANTTCSSSCSSDSQCIDGENGRCFPWEGLVSLGGCSYDECFTDSNCGSRTPCICRSSPTDNNANMCDVGGNCALDSDCGPGGYCSPSMETCYSTNPEAVVEGRNYGGPNPYYCHTASDLCINDSDCASPDAGTATTPTLTYTPCAYNVQDERWECTQLVCGLP